MGTCPREIQAGPVVDGIEIGVVLDEGEVEVTDAALGAYGRMRAIIGERLRTHPAPDGGLICEDRKVYTRPALWRIAPDGAVLPDSRYSFTLGAFAPVALPQGL
jgi:hypothetical protein